MELKEFFLAQLDRDTASSRKTLERVPEGRNDWKPHEKSMPLGYLASLVASMPGWITLMIDREELNLEDPSNEFTPKVIETRAELLSRLEESAAKARKALEGTTEAHLLKPWPSADERF
jgi:hypothetical protein